VDTVASRRLVFKSDFVEALSQVDLVLAGGLWKASPHLLLKHENHFTILGPSFGAGDILRDYEH
jgi:hypothetical protein